jgi:hypothetical protein
MAPECGIGAEPLHRGLPLKGQSEPRRRRPWECDRQELETVIEPCRERRWLERVRVRPTGSWSIIVAGFSGEAKGALF